MFSNNLFTDRRFTPLFWAQFLCYANINIFRNALIILITYQEVRLLGLSYSAVVAVCGGIFVLPVFLFSGPAGNLADKADKGFLVRIMKTGEIAVMLIAAYGLETGNYGILLLALFFTGTLSAFFGPLKFSILPEIVPRAKLVSANGYIVASTFIAIILGSMAGGIATTVEHPERVLTVGLLCMAVVGLVSGWCLPRLGSHGGLVRKDFSITGAMWMTLRLIHRRRSIFFSILGISWFWLLGGAVLTFIPLFTKQNLHATEAVVTLLLMVFAFGVVAGSIFCDFISSNQVEPVLIPTGALGIAISLGDLGWNGLYWNTGLAGNIQLSLGEFLLRGDGWRIIIDAFSTAFFSALFVMPLYSFIQERGERAFTSRIMAGNNIMNALFGVVGAMIAASLFLSGVGVPFIFFLFVFTTIALTIFLLIEVQNFFLPCLAWVAGKLLYCWTVEGVERLPDENPVVLWCDHAYQMDWVLMARICRRPVRFFTNSYPSPGIFKKMIRHLGIASLGDGGRVGSSIAMAATHGLETLLNNEVFSVCTRTGLNPAVPPPRRQDGMDREGKAPALTLVPVSISRIPKAASDAPARILSMKNLPKLRKNVAIRFGEPIEGLELSQASLEYLIGGSLSPVWCHSALEQEAAI